MSSVDPLFAEFAGATCAVVGNAPEIGAAGAAIDSATHVVRFNNAPGFGGATGSRVTHLALVNRGGQMREWLADPGFTDRPAVRAAAAFVLPYPMLPEDVNVPEQVCFTREALALLRPLGKPIHILPETLHARARHVLAPRTSGVPNPSTGFLVTLALLSRRPADARPIDVFGFGFAGWAGHPWAAESAFFADAAAAGRLTINPLERP